MKRTAFLLLFVHLTLTGYMTIGIGGHLLKHGQATNHAMQHTSFVCAWMCTASSFVHTVVPQLDQIFYPFFELPVFNKERYKALSALPPSIRGPPLSSFQAYFLID